MILNSRFTVRQSASRAISAVAELLVINRLQFSLSAYTVRLTNVCIIVICVNIIIIITRT